MTRKFFFGLLALASPACDPPSNEATTPATAIAQGVPPRPAGCADSLVADFDRDSFSGPDVDAGQAELDRWTRDSATAFKAAAAKLCGQGKLTPSDLAPFKQLLVQYGGGADSAAIWVDDARPAAIILQYAYFPGSPAPPVEEVEVALSCWQDPDTPACLERLP